MVKTRSEHSLDPSVHLRTGELALHEEVEVGSGELLMDGLQQDVVRLAFLRPLPPPSSCCSSGTQERLELRRVGEAEGGAIDEAVQSEERQGDGRDVPQTAPALTEDGDVRNDAEQRLGRPKQDKHRDTKYNLEDRTFSLDLDVQWSPGNERSSDH